MSKAKAFVQAVNNVMSGMTDALNRRLEKFSLSPERLVAALFSGLMLSYVFELIRHGDYGTLGVYFNQIRMVPFLMIAGAGCGLLIVLTAWFKWPRLIPWALLLLCGAVSYLWIGNYSGDNAFPFILGVGVFDLIVLLWLLSGNKLGLPGGEKARIILRACGDIGNAIHRTLTGGLNRLLQKLHLSVGTVITALLASLVFSHVFVLLGTKKFNTITDYFDSIPVLTYTVITLAAFAALLLSAVLLKTQRLCAWALLLFTVTASFLLALHSQGYIQNGSDYGNVAYYTLAIGAIDLALILWLVRGDKLGLSGIRISRRAALIAAAVMFAAATAAFGYFTSLKYYTYSTATFDFGIFSQMFERMAETGLPYTTVERSYMMLHYGVHFSPFFYLFLPGYYLFRSPIYLYYIQAAGIAAGVFAVWLLAGKLGLSGKLTLALEALYIFYPCLLDGAFYDFHENKFLTAVILFLFYFIVSKRPIGIFLLSLMLLSIKEDAAIYLMVIAVFVILNRREIFTGVMMLLLAIVYFVIAQQVVAASGVEGVMMDRLNDYFINGEQTFGSVIKAVLFDLGYAIRQIFVAEKLPFMIWMLAPAVFAPIMTKKISSLVLLLPILPINLMQSWQYQYNVDYQYTYGVAALIILSAVFVFIRLSSKARRAAVLTALCVCLTMSTALNAPKIKKYTGYLNNSRTVYEQVDEVLAMIPDDATVTASDTIVPHLSHIKWLFTAPDYKISNWDKLPIKPYEADYFVLDTRYRNNESRYIWLTKQMADNYTLVEAKGFAELYERKVKIEVRE